MSSNIFRLAELSIGTASRLANYNIGKVVGATAILQAGVLHLQRTDHRVAKDTYKITAVLIILNCLGTLWTAGKLAKILQDKYQFSLISPKMLTNNWTVPDWSTSKIFLVSFWEKNPAVALRSFSIYNAMACNIIEEHRTQFMIVLTILFGEPSTGTRCLWVI